MGKETLGKSEGRWGELRLKLKELKGKYYKREILSAEYIAGLLKLGYSGYWLRAEELGGPTWNDERERSEAAVHLGLEGGKSDCSPFFLRWDKYDREKETFLGKALIGLVCPPGFQEAVCGIFKSQLVLTSFAFRIENHIDGLFSREGVMRSRFDYIVGFEGGSSEGNVRKAALGRFRFPLVAGILDWSGSICQKQQERIEGAFPRRAGEVVIGLQKVLASWIEEREDSDDVTADKCDEALRKSLAVLARGSDKGIEIIWDEFRRYRHRRIDTRKEKEEWLGSGGSGRR